MEKLLKRIIDFILSLFRITKNINQKTKTMSKNPIIHTKHLTFKEKRDEYLRKRGYSVINKITSKKRKTVQLTPFQQSLYIFRKLKKENRIVIKSYTNRMGIPHYDIKKPYLTD